MSDFLIVGLGASAGGIKALKAFFEATPPDAGMAFVVILHLSPNHDSQLAQLLQSVTAMPVMQVEEKTYIKQNSVYVISPDKHLTIDGGYLNISPNIQIEERRAPVDIFFRSLAESLGRMAVSVVLSGTGANGSMGMKRVKEHGGAVFVQNPREAQFSEMPRSSIATDLVDDVLNVADIPGRIIAYRDGLAATRLLEERRSDDEASQQALREVFTQLRARTGHDFSNYKRPTLLRRIERRISIRNLPDVSAYAAYIRQHPEETQALLKDLLISVTNFFRDSPAFDRLKTDILPKLFEGKGAGDELRIWVVACATGEEAYSIAMLCAEITLGMTDAPKVQILATDIDEAAISAAREGLYTLNDAADIPPELLARHFTKEGEHFRIRREIRETILFASHNFLKDPPYSRLDLVTCRNVLIYLNHTAQQRAMETFHFALKPEGFLFLGLSESVDDGASDLFISVYREQHIWQRRQLVARHFIMPESAHRSEARPVPEKKQTAAVLAARTSFGDLHQQMLELYAPPSLVVNEDYNIVHLTNRAVRYLQLTGGELSQNLLKIIRDELRADVRNALYQASKQGIAIMTPHLKLRIENDTETVCIHIRPALDGADLTRGFLLVLFEQVTDGENIAAITIAQDEPASQLLEAEITRLRTQLRTSNEQHELAAEDMKAGNEELQALNEELRSAGEELETSKEELQSINEELATVNQELKVKVEESGMISNNLRNIINSTDVGTIILDRSFRVTLFSPAVRSIYNLIQADQGRPLSDITSYLPENSLLADAERVLNSLQGVEREIDTIDNRSFLVRISPYRTEEDHIQGVVLTFLDITDRRREEKALAFLAQLSEDFGPRGNVQDLLAMAGERLASFLKLSGFSFALVDEEADRISTIYEWRRDEHQCAARKSVRIFDLLTKKGFNQYRKGAPIVVNDVAQSALLAAASKQSEGLKTAALIHIPYLEGTDWKALMTVYRDAPTEWLDNEINMVRELATRIYIRIQRANTEDALGISVERLKLAASVSGFGIHDYNVAEKKFYWSPELLAIVGYAPTDELRFEDIVRLIHPDDREQVEDEMRSVMAPDRDGRFTGEFRILRADTGELRWIYNRSQTTFKGSGSRRRAVRNTGIIIDITDRKKSEEALHASEELLRITVESATDYAIITTDAYGIITGWSRGAERAFGWTEEEISGQEINIIFTPEDRAAGVPQAEKATSVIDGFALDERWHFRKDGTRFFMSGVMRPIADEQLRGFVKVARDLTERQQAEEAMRISEERYRTSLQAAEMGAWDWNVVDNSINWNEQHYLMLGVEPQQAERDVSYFLQFVHPADIDAVKAALDRAIGEAGMYQSEFRIIRQDNGATRWMAGFGRVVSRVDGRPTRMVGVMYDITARKRVEEQREEFIGIASHELRTPLAALKAYSEVLQDIFNDADDGQNAGLMAKMEGQIDRLSEIVRDLLDVTRVREGRLDLRIQHFDLTTLISDVADDLRLTTQHKIEVDIVPETMVHADRERIRQVLINLISNAIKYSPDADWVIVSAKKEEGFIIVCVQDFGIGMTAEVAARVFDRFYRAEDASVSTYPGLGLGLFISAEIISGHEGRMWVESQRHHGSLFFFSLPYGTNRA